MASKGYISNPVVKKGLILFLSSFFLLSCSTIKKERAFNNGVVFSTIRTYELLVMENYELLNLMEEEGDTGPSRRRNLIVGRLNSALYHLGGTIKMIEGKKEWPQEVYKEIGDKEALNERREYMKALKEKWEREWKESFDSEAEGPYRELALETYIRYGNAFGILE